MLVSFLVLGQLFTFLMALYLVSILHIFFGLFKGLLSLHYRDHRLIKIERLNFSLVLERTL